MPLKANQLWEIKLVLKIISQKVKIECIIRKLLNSIFLIELWN